MSKNQSRGCLSHLAFKSANTLGRRNTDDPDLIWGDRLDCFWIDVQKIMNSKAIRRLNGKTQVWPFPVNPLIRNRYSHTMEVMSIAVTLAQLLGLNVNLVMAIALVHDIGHTPFGHLGERELRKTVGVNFSHEVFSVILADKIERQGRGLNLSFEVLQGAPYHSCGSGPIIIDPSLPPEYMVVLLADKFAYLPSDINDALRMGYLKREDLPSFTGQLGTNQREWVNTCIQAVIEESSRKGVLSFSESAAATTFEDVKDWMYKRVYLRLDREPERAGYANHIQRAYLFLEEHCRLVESNPDPATTLALLTDQEVMSLSQLRSDGTIRRAKDLANLGFLEVLPYCQRQGFELKDIDLSWAENR